MTAIGTVSASPETIAALATLFGLLVGALDFSVSTCFTQSREDQRELFARKVSRREQLHSEFTSESVRISLLGKSEHSDYIFFFGSLDLETGGF
jgi:hypothetical protein